MKTARMLLSLAFSVAGLILLSSQSAYAGTLAQLSAASVSLSDSRPSQTSVYSFQWSIGSTAGGYNLELVRFLFCTTPSGACTAPATMGVNYAGTPEAGSLKSTGTTNIDPFADQFDATNVGANEVRLTRNAGGAITVNAGALMTASLSQVTNNEIDDCPGYDNSAGTCYVRIYLCNDSATPANCSPEAGSTTVMGTTILSYTVVGAVTVSARVDPAFTFVVAGVAAGQSVGEAGVATTVASTYNTLPFGNLTPGTPRYAAHDLQVISNSSSGYSITMQMLNQMVGIYGPNNIDPFTGNSATYVSPAAWQEPPAGNTTPSVNTGWIGFNTSDTDIWGAPTGLWAPVPDTTNNPNTSYAVMRKSSADNGTSHVFVYYAMEVNISQPADTYTGTLMYNALPLY